MTIVSGDNLVVANSINDDQIVFIFGSGEKCKVLNKKKLKKKKKIAMIAWFMSKCSKS